MVALKIKSGRSNRIFALEEDGRCEMLDFLSDIFEKHNDKFLKLVKYFDRTADIGLIQNPERFRSLNKEIHEFKVARIHFLCFLDSQDTIVLTNGFMNNESDSCLRHAEKIKIRYYSAKRNGYLTYREGIL